MGRQSAVHGQHRSGNPARLVRNKEGGRFSYVVRTADMPQRIEGVDHL